MRDASSLIDLGRTFRNPDLHPGSTAHQSKRHAICVARVSTFQQTRVCPRERRTFHSDSAGSQCLQAARPARHMSNDQRHTGRGNGNGTHLRAISGSSSRVVGAADGIVACSCSRSRSALMITLQLCSHRFFLSLDLASVPFFDFSSSSGDRNSCSTPSDAIFS